MHEEIEDIRKRLASIDGRLARMEERSDARWGSFYDKLTNIYHQANWCSGALVVIAVILVKETFFK